MKSVYFHQAVGKYSSSFYVFNVACYYALTFLQPIWISIFHDGVVKQNILERSKYQFRISWVIKWEIEFVEGYPKEQDCQTSQLFSFIKLSKIYLRSSLLRFHVSITSTINIPSQSRTDKEKQLVQIHAEKMNFLSWMGFIPRTTNSSQQRVNHFLSTRNSHLSVTIYKLHVDSIAQFFDKKFFSYTIRKLILTYNGPRALWNEFHHRRKFCSKLCLKV